MENKTRITRDIGAMMADEIVAEQQAAEALHTTADAALMEAVSKLSDTQKEQLREMLGIKTEDSDNGDPDTDTDTDTDKDPDTDRDKGDKGGVE